MIEVLGMAFNAGAAAIRSGHVWLNTPLSQEDFRWLLSGARVGSWLFLIVLFMTTLRNALGFKLLKYYVPLLFFIFVMCLYYTDQLFIEPVTPPRLIPAVIIFNVAICGTVFSAFILSVSARRLVGQVAEDKTPEELETLKKSTPLWGWVRRRKRKRDDP